jgi:MurNAc alpha-1-phosphate uridylyltransferase
MESCTGLETTGDFKRAADGRITHRFDEPTADLAWMGVQIINPAILDPEPVEPFSFRRVWKRVQDNGRLYGAMFDGFWLHVGSPDALATAEARLAQSAGAPAP